MKNTIIITPTSSKKQTEALAQVIKLGEQNKGQANNCIDGVSFGTIFFCMVFIDLGKLR
jgi:hypothetical protein